MASATGRLSRVSCKLVEDAGALTFRAVWVFATSRHTADWSFLDFTASFSSFVEIIWLEVSKRCTFSPPRWLHRPCSTQKADTGTLPDFDGRTKSLLITRSC